MKTKGCWVRAVLLAVLLALLTLAGVILAKGWLGGEFSSAERMRAYIASFGVWGPAVLTLIQLVLSVLPVCPSFFGCVAGAALFGAAGSFWANYIGISLGSLTAYWLAKHCGAELVNSLLPTERYSEYSKKLRLGKGYARFLFLAILLPLAPDNFLCYFSGLIRMPAKKFTAIIIAAKPWCILFYSIFFAYFI